MKGTIDLMNPIKINGKNVKKLSYDTDEITPELFAEAESRKQKAGKSSNGNLSGAMELDYSLHLYMGIASVIAINEDYTFDDVERVKGRDIMSLSRVGRNFIFNTEESPEESSEEQSETSPASSTPASQTSKEKD